MKPTGVWYRRYIQQCKNVMNQEPNETRKNKNILTPSSTLANYKYTLPYTVLRL
jgi:hypothetical protein